MARAAESIADEFSESAAFARALTLERERNGRQITGFRFFALLTVFLLQVVFSLLLDGWVGAPMLPLAGYAVLAALAWRLRGRFNAYAAWSGYTIAVVDLPMAFWLVRSSSIASVATFDGTLPGAVMMMLPLAYAGFIAMASLALDTRQTWTVATIAIVFQWVALAEMGHDFTFLSMITAFTLLVAWICVYWREQTVRMVRQTSTEQLQRERLGRYFSPQVASLVAAGAMTSQAERREVTVLFADLRDFTRRSEGLDPREVVVLLNRFHAAMVEMVFAHGGTLDKYLGDGLMAYFGAPVEQADQAERAVRCALGMQEQLDNLNGQAPLARTDPLRMGIGINTGQAVVGDIGADARREFTVIGDAVNVAARLEQLTKEHGQPVLVSAATVAATRGALAFRGIGSVALRGRAEEVEIFIPKPSPEPSPESSPEQ